MALFGKKDSAKDADKKSETEVKTKTVKVSNGEVKDLSFAAGVVIKNPRITEKTAYASDNNVYAFDVSPRATKVEVMRAVLEIYKFKPTKVNIVSVPVKRVFRRNSVGVKGGGKKAYVYLKKGDKIEFV